MDPVARQKRELGVLLRSVVKVLCVSDASDYEQPWQTAGSENSTGSGAIVETSRGLRVLTNAHCVENHVYVEVRRYGKARKYAADVEIIGHECDLALIEVADPSFFAGTVPIQLGSLPHLSDKVSVCGYPIGGERLSITQGIVSRIDLVHYAQTQRRLLAVQIDAAINSGNSGGPVLKDGRLVGIAFQALDEAEKIGYMIAVPVIEHFLEDVEDGIYDGFPSLGALVQHLESPSHRRALGLPDDQDAGVLVTKTCWGSSCWGVLERGDVLLEIDGVPVGADGTVLLREGEIVDFAYAFARQHVGGTCKVKLWRRGSELECVLPLRAPRPLVPEDRYDVRPTYFIFGGLLFVPLTKNYLQTYDDPWWQTAPRDLMAHYDHGWPSPERQEVVILQKVLADRVNQGYHDFESTIVLSVDGVAVRSVAHLVEIFELGEGRFIRIETEHGEQVVIDRKLALERQAPIFERYGVPADRSDDLID